MATHVPSFPAEAIDAVGVSRWLPNTCGCEIQANSNPIISADAAPHGVADLRCRSGAARHRVTPSTTFAVTPGTRECVAMALRARDGALETACGRWRNVERSEKIRFDRIDRCNRSRSAHHRPLAMILGLYGSIFVHSRSTRDGTQHRCARASAAFRNQRPVPASFPTSGQCAAASSDSAARSSYCRGRSRCGCCSANRGRRIGSEKITFSPVFNARFLPGSFRTDAARNHRSLMIAHSERCDPASPPLTIPSERSRAPQLKASSPAQATSSRVRT